MKKYVKSERHGKIKIMGIRVKKETTAIRCEICHQTDEYDEKNNFCKRCSILPSELLQAKKVELRKEKLVNYDKFLLIIFFASSFLNFNMKEFGSETFKSTYFYIFTILGLIQTISFGVFLIRGCRGFKTLLKIDKIQQYKTDQRNHQYNGKV